MLAPTISFLSSPDTDTLCENVLVDGLFYFRGMALIEGENARWCKDCKELKHFDEFWKNKSGKYGLHARCKHCQYKKQKEYWKNNPEKYKKVLKNNRERYTSEENK
ncbi:MAG TPA: hypothetical protein VLA13_05600, partial [Massilibacterium sp.]|nr:hypothetical protein [Massilibacterium sp.]